MSLQKFSWNVDKQHLTTLAAAGFSSEFFSDATAMPAKGVMAFFR